MFILVFSVYLDWLPFVFRSDLAATGFYAWWWEELKQSIMPVAVIGLFQGATWTRFVRSAVLDVIQLDYVTTTRAKGLPESGVVLKHIVRNALIPVVTLNCPARITHRVRWGHHHRADLPGALASDRC